MEPGRIIAPVLALLLLAGCLGNVDTSGQANGVVGVEQPAAQDAAKPGIANPHKQLIEQIGGRIGNITAGGSVDN